MIEYLHTKLTCDTTCDVGIKSGKAYAALISAPKQPVMTVGTAGILKTAFTPSGDNWLFKMTAVGKIGKSTGIYANNQKLFIATVK